MATEACHDAIRDAVDLVREARFLRMADRHGGFVTTENWQRWEERAGDLLLAQPATPDDLDELRRRLGSGADHEHGWDDFDRTLCACGTMHTYCRCGSRMDDCEAAS